jgi:phospholipid/cholesterol/gamma-HCH transport system substrate-binding protein
MDKAETKRAVIVGIFVALAIIIFLAGVLTLGGLQKTFVRHVALRTTFDDVAGLKKGNSVWFSGVKVGTISSIRFAGVSQVEVAMEVDAAAQPFIHRNASVKISTDGLIGNKIILIDGGSPNLPAVQDGDNLQAEKMLSTDEILKTLQQNNANLLAITTNFKTLSGKLVQGKGIVGTLLTDSAAALRFKAILLNLQQTTAASTQMAERLSSFSQRLNTKGGLADKLLTDTVIYARLKTSATNLNTVVRTAQSISSNMDKAMQQLNRNDNSLGLLLNDTATANQLKSTLRNLNESSIKLNEDLEAAQHNFLLKGYFKDKAKKQAQEAAKKP